ncbi:polyprenyl synthetase family protein, partial [Streptomyces thioluteus]|uniref:polyprenyl synthetase family protein n=1 Tax=Streptomyces thioluteus TaxID=66431 RepID=UPI0031EFB919
ATGLGEAEGAAVAGTFVAMCEGMAREIGDQYNTERREDDYFAAVEGKTAALISAACRLGALGCGLSASAVEAVSSYGRLMGTAFQIVDDIHDLTLPPGSTGKPPGQDLAAGIYTLPVLRARCPTGPAWRTCSPRPRPVPTPPTPRRKAPRRRTPPRRTPPRKQAAPRGRYG